MPIPPILELVGLAIRNIGDVPNLARRAELLDAAAEACLKAGDTHRANSLRVTADELRRADDAQLQLHELFSTVTDR